jgi:hypothetical protein
MKICVKCNQLKKHHKNKSRANGLQVYCMDCTGSGSNRPYRKHIKEQCKECSFVPQHSCQLDVDHIDGNHLNNDPSNLQTLCANCHRLKTYLYDMTRAA